MSFQYIHTSAKRGLEPGKSGFCCVARELDTPPDLIQEFEQQSRYTLPAKGGTPIILRYRIVNLRSGTYHILSRIQDSGADYSKRNNHIAHHIAFTVSEIFALPNPASILIDWGKWRDHWNEPPRIFEKEDSFSLTDLKTTRHSLDLTGHFPPTVKYGEAFSRAFETSAIDQPDLIEHFLHGLKELRFKEQWLYPFTNTLLPTDRPDDYVWKGVLENLSLPYEIDFSSSSLGKKTNPNPSEAPYLTPPDSPEPNTQKPETSSIRTAPHVEIPEAFDRKKRRRPKRKFGKHELSKSINYALAATTLLSIGIIFHFYKSNQKSVKTLIHEKTSVKPPRKLTPTQLATAAWKSFVLANYPAAELPTIAKHTSALARTGDTDPTTIITFLLRLQSDNPILLSSSATIPAQLLKIDPVSQTTQLTLSPDNYPNLSTLAIAPSVIATQLQNLAPKTPHPTPNTQHPVSIFKNQENLRYNSDVFITSLQLFEQTTTQAIRPSDPNTHTSMDAFFTQKDALLANAQVAPFLKIHSAFDLPDSAAYIPFNNSGLLVATNDQSFSNYIKTIFTDHILAHYDSFKSTTAFRGAFSRIGSGDFTTTIQVTQAIYETMLLAQPTTAEHQAKWEGTQEIWANAFIRSNLMEETIISYTIEALESSKLSLKQLQSQFTLDDLTARQRLLQFTEQVNGLIKQVQSNNENEEWVVFDKQSTQLVPESQ